MTYDDACSPRRADLNELFAVSRELPARSASGLNDLAARALARMCEQTGAGIVSAEAKLCMQFPVATALARALCDDGSDTADLIVADLIDAGLSVEDVCLDHLAPAAQCLGEWWESDRVPFTDVTMASSRIQSMLCRMPALRRMPAASRQKGAVFGAVPGEEHTLGVLMAADLFRRQGWDVTLLVGLGHDEMLARLSRDDRPVIGLSCSGSHSVPALRDMITDLRRARPDAEIMVSGGVTGDADALSSLPQPDAIVATVDEAQARMDALAERLADATRQPA